MATDTGAPSSEWYPDIWKTSYRVEVKPREHFPEGKMVETTVATHTYQLYPHEARYLRDLLNAADLGPTCAAAESSQLSAEPSTVAGTGK